MVLFSVKRLTTPEDFQLFCPTVGQIAEDEEKLSLIRLHSDEKSCSAKMFFL